MKLWKSKFTQLYGREPFCCRTASTIVLNKVEKGTNCKLKFKFKNNTMQKAYALHIFAFCRVNDGEIHNKAIFSKLVRAL